MDTIIKVRKKFIKVQYFYIYRELNEKMDKLSKEATYTQGGILQEEETSKEGPLPMKIHCLF